MKPNILPFLGFGFIVPNFICGSCGKPQIIAPVENHIMEQAFPSTKYDVSILNGTKYYLEVGFKFKVNQQGKVTKLGVKTPEIGTYRVTLWDADNQIALATVPCRYNDSTTFAMVDIASIPLSPHKNYYLTFSIKGEKFYWITPKSGMISYPIQATSSVALIACGFYQASLKLEDGRIPKFPSDTAIYFAHGFPDFDFQPY